MRGSESNQVFRRGEETARGPHIALIDVRRMFQWTTGGFARVEAGAIGNDTFGSLDRNDECAIRYFGLLKPSTVSTEYLR